ncbi:MAG: GNAT family N-acetyltransferase [Eubacterium sp.]|nr:GNAT family N-acetyltransferase [Eubacterium sp.]
MVSIIETKEYNEEHIALWQQAFGDSEDDILFFLENTKHMSCLCLYDDRLCSMLFLVDCKISVSDNAYKYIYAACTDKACRSSGYMSMLLSYAKANYSNIVLIPADDSLVSYYSERNFNYKVDINSILFNECDEIKEYLFEGCTLENPFALAYIGD